METLTSEHYAEKKCATVEGNKKIKVTRIQHPSSRMCQINPFRSDNEMNDKFAHNEEQVCPRSLLHESYCFHNTFEKSEFEEKGAGCAKKEQHKKLRWRKFAAIESSAPCKNTKRKEDCKLALAAICDKV